MIVKLWAHVQFFSQMHTVHSPKVLNYPKTYQRNLARSRAA